MNGVTIKFDESLQHLIMTVSPSEMDEEISVELVYAWLKNTEFNEVYVSESALKQVCGQANDFKKSNNSSSIEVEIGERKNAQVAFHIDDDEMSATLTLTAPYGGHYPSKKAVLTLAKKNNIIRGVSQKRIVRMLKRLKQAAPGDIIEDCIAKGLPAKNGHSSHVKPLVPNALERVLKPQVSEDGKTDPRNLGDIVCVKADVPVLRRLPPTDGRAGYTVKNTPLEPLQGQWIPINLGEGTKISSEDKNLVVSITSGMPKFFNLVMTVDDTFISKGVDVSTGHIKYDGAVLVKGDVAENMKIEASGDVTVIGFVESAYIEAGGDIIITEGAVGKDTQENEDFSCILKSSGGIHVQHGQGLHITCLEDVSVGKQLAHSKISCGGSVVVGKHDNPNGSLFGCEIETTRHVLAGTLGAVSGGSLNIDFSQGFNQLLSRIDSINALVQQIKQNTDRHKKQMQIISSKSVPSELLGKLDETRAKFNDEIGLLKWLEKKVDELKIEKDSYTSQIKVVANEKLYSGVNTQLDNRNWRSEREYDRAHIFYKDHNWIYEPITR
ncbi:DUF342 domain-containing protein [Alteromonas sp. 5E99-2]|uniref:FapA family protein n=1 Tax=Alteromonas sp. 5E99-2 TaxID=2817683 RepID=UPI001A984D11|nr:FapA family protein [Alteromonas sp. 5E99-2]MBO1254935.1 DUF342 domain-containing protein [Alteromonas sp. 5E99-2]